LQTAAIGQPVVTDQRAFQVASLGSPGPGIITDPIDGGDGTSGGDGSDGSTGGEVTTGGNTGGSSGGGSFGLPLLMLLLFSVVRRR